MLIQVEQFMVQLVVVDTLVQVEMEVQELMVVLEERVLLQLLFLERHRNPIILQMVLQMEHLCVDNSLEVAVVEHMQLEVLLELVV